MSIPFFALRATKSVRFFCCYAGRFSYFLCFVKHVYNIYYTHQTVSINNMPIVHQTNGLFHNFGRFRVGLPQLEAR